MHENQVERFVAAALRGNDQIIRVAGQIFYFSIRLKKHRKIHTFLIAVIILQTISSLFCVKVSNFQKNFKRCLFIKKFIKKFLKKNDNCFVTWQAPIFLLVHRFKSQFAEKLFVLCRTVCKIEMFDSLLFFIFTTEVRA
ncbi:MAG: hypothetical protein AVDCRST_MAG74-1085 [uncultured Pyrinomonadaceae bacterium]|uniref:Uncharacterized protein n=1 Tax=uncultured Pyrinomonadaceae bacterium TaxID=2283094 RepID=A0A6J4NR66_9BACT|nr:MAG: hypothetical protein AVDCRST_MAG74-1085 [uncultured Pyrinomonadaceae bacterium]